MKLGLQLYTVRDAYQTQEELKEVLRNVKDMGYEGVEFAGYAGFAAEELKAFLEEIKLEPISSHVAIGELEAKAEEALEYAKKLGCKWLVCCWAPASNVAEVEHLVTELNRVKKLASEYGIELLYHNHPHEFKAIEDGSIPMDKISNVCNLELDTYWVFNVGIEPCTYIQKNAEKISLIHIKDGNLSGNPCAIGEGYNNIKGIQKISEEIGIEWLIVENDNPTPDGLSDVRRSMQYFTK